MSMNLLLITRDDRWRRFMKEELGKRGFSRIRDFERNAEETFVPDSILLDVSDYDWGVDVQVHAMLERYPLCEWILFYSGEARWGDVRVLSRGAYEIMPKTANVDRVCVYILAACMRKRHTEQRLKDLKRKRAVPASPSEEEW